MPEVTLTQEDKGKSIAVKPGDTLAISLRENATTGFRWELEQGDDEILEPLGSVYARAPGSSPGSGGMRIWKFKARQEGDARLEFKLWRSWEGDTSIVERFDATIMVHNRL